MDLGRSFTEFVPKPQSTQPVTDLSPHVDGGYGGATGTNTTARPDERAVLFRSVAIVLAALALLWLFGGLSFRGSLL